MKVTIPHIDSIFYLSRMTSNAIFKNCWEYNCKNGNYGKITISKNSYMLAHRASALIFIGDIKNKVVRHSCDNPRCFNPDHLKIGTQKENIQDQFDRGRHRYSNYTNCKNKHELTKDNIYLTSKGHRQCRICKKAAKLRWKLRQEKLNLLK